MAALALPTAAAAGSTAAAARHVVSSTCRQSPRQYVAPHALDAVQFVSASTGWVAGADRVLATTDGGAHWHVQRQVAKADYSEVDAIDAHHAWVVGKTSVIHTTNGGRSWHRLAEPCRAISSLHFISARDGFAVAGGRLLGTSDAGRSWHALSAPRTVQSVCFTSAQDGWLGARGKVYRTVSGGATWTRTVATKQPKGVGGYPFAMVQCSGPDSGWAELIGPGVGMNQQEHIGYYLNDDGASKAIFAEQYYAGPHPVTRRNSPGPYFAAMSSIDPADAAFVDTCAPCGRGTSPLVIATRDGNTLHRLGKVRHVNYVLGAAFASMTSGWAVGYVDGSHADTWKIVHTSDGGHHWVTQYVE